MTTQNGKNKKSQHGKNSLFIIGLMWIALGFVDVGSNLNI